MEVALGGVAVQPRWDVRQGGTRMRDVRRLEVSGVRRR